MKYYVSILIAFIFIGCFPEINENAMDAFTDINSFYYWKDNRTNLCFISRSGYGYNNFVLSTVPCDSIPKNLMKN